jgi:hypothetical protein
MFIDRIRCLSPENSVYATPKTRKDEKFVKILLTDKLSSVAISLVQPTPKLSLPSDKTFS